MLKCYGNEGYRMKTADLTGAALDWAVASIEHPTQMADFPLMYDADDFRYSTDWSWGGPIIEREGIWLSLRGLWAARRADSEFYQGYTPLIAAMRCYVASKLGDEIDIPEELL